MGSVINTTETNCDNNINSREFYEHNSVSDMEGSYVLFEMIKQLKPNSILDAGMFLEKLGMISRQAMGAEIPAEIYLKGVSFNKKEHLPIYDTVYDEIKYGEIFSDKFDLGFFMYSSKDIEVAKREAIWDEIATSCTRLIADMEDTELVQYMVSKFSCQEIDVGQKKFMLVLNPSVKGDDKLLDKRKPVNERPDSELRDVKVYIATHKAFNPPEMEGYIPLHVGKEGKADLGFAGDNTGDNMSEMNPYYCEMTGVYWIWKNISCDVAGLSHYRRYFTRMDHILTVDEIREVLKSYDVIVGNSSMANEGSVKAHYQALHNISDMEVCRKVMEETCPEYVEAYDLCMEANLLNIANMLICPKKIFDEYCEWVFPLLAEVEKRVDMTGYDDFQKRLYGYLTERLLRIWLIAHKYRVREEMITLVD